MDGGAAWSTQNGREESSHSRWVEWGGAWLEYCGASVLWQSAWLGHVGKSASHPAGITNHDEYSLVREIMEEKKEEQTGTLKKDKTLLRDEKKMEKLKQKLHTDDECEAGEGGVVEGGFSQGGPFAGPGGEPHGRGAELVVLGTGGQLGRAHGGWSGAA